MFKVGDKVRIVKRNLNESGRCKYRIRWSQSMDIYNGLVITIKNEMIYNDNSIFFNNFYFSHEWLELVREPNYLNLLIKEYEEV